jgi:hypothetical protein
LGKTALPKKYLKEITMKHSIFTITAIITLAIPAAASASTFAESFERDLDRNHTQISTTVRSGQDSFQQYVNRAINGSDTLFASFNRDLYRTATPAVPATRSTDSIQQLINIALRGNNNPLIASFERVIGIEIAAVANDQNTFQWNPELITAFV